MSYPAFWTDNWVYRRNILLNQAGIEPVLPETHNPPSMRFDNALRSLANKEKHEEACRTGNEVGNAKFK